VNLQKEKCAVGAIKYTTLLRSRS